MGGGGKKRRAAERKTSSPKADKRAEVCARMCIASALACLRAKYASLAAAAYVVRHSRQRRSRKIASATRAGRRRKSPRLSPAHPTSSPLIPARPRLIPSYPRLSPAYPRPPHRRSSAQEDSDEEPPEAEAPAKRAKAAAAKCPEKDGARRGRGRPVGGKAGQADKDSGRAAGAAGRKAKSGFELFFLETKDEVWRS